MSAALARSISTSVVSAPRGGARAGRAGAVVPLAAAKKVKKIKNETRFGGAIRAPRRAGGGVEKRSPTPPGVASLPSTDLVDWKVGWAPPRAGRAGARGGTAEATALEKGNGGAAPSSFPRSTRPVPPPRPTRTRPDRVVYDLGYAVDGCSEWRVVWDGLARRDGVRGSHGRSVAAEQQRARGASARRRPFPLARALARPGWAPTDRRAPLIMGGEGLSSHDRVWGTERKLPLPGRALQEREEE
jgi:hypothetical protein